MLHNDSAIDLGDLEEELFVSRTTLDVDLKSIKIMLDNFYPNISLSRQKGRVSLDCTEFSARYLLYQLFLVDYKAHKDAICDGPPFFADIGYPGVLTSVIDIMKKNRLHICDENVTKIASLVCIFKQRMQNGKFIAKLEHSGDHMELSLLDFAKELYDTNIKPSVGESPKEELEIKQLSIFLSFINLLQSSNTFYSKFNYQPSIQMITIAKELLRRIREDYQLDLEGDEALFSSLIWHINALVNRLRHHVVEKNPISEVMKNEYPFMFELSLYLYDLFQTHLHLDLSEGDVSYVAAYLAAAVERRGFIYKSSKVRIAFVSHLRSSISSMAMAKLQSEYNAVAVFDGPYSSYQYKEIVERETDAILTIGAGFSQKNSLPIYNINDIFSKPDKRSLDVFIQNIRQKKYRNDYFAQSENFIDKFHQDFYFHNLTLSTSEEVITHMCNVMEKAQVIPKEFHCLTLEREDMTPTLMKNHIAIPHPLRPCAHTTRIGVATMEKGVSWGDYYAKLVFLLAITPEEKNFIKVFFEFIIDLMENEKIIQQIVTADNFGLFINHVSSLLPENP
jgi:transcriptional antiterminator/mannitol/fructose-specific phosphotransferase system IIA component (Ntr-type)